MARLGNEKIPDLLESVKRRPALYNFDSSRRTGERHLRSQLWEQVGADLNCAAEDCKETWQGMRTRLRIETAKVADGGLTLWRWYDDMQFFVPHLGTFPSSRPNKKVPVNMKNSESGGKKKHWRHSITERLKQYKAKSDGSERRRTLPAYAAKSTSQSAAWLKSSPNSHSVTGSASILDKHSSFSPPRLAYNVSHSSQAEEPPSDRESVHSVPTALSLQRVQSQPNGGSVFKAPSTVTSLQDEENSVGATGDRKSLTEYKEYHFVCCLMEMLEDVPANKRNVVKAKIMAEIGAAYQ